MWEYGSMATTGHLAQFQFYSASKMIYLLVLCLGNNHGVFENKKRCANLQVWISISEKARLLSVCTEHFQQKMLKSMENFRRGTKAKTSAQSLAKAKTRGGLQ